MLFNMNCSVIVWNPPSLTSDLACSTISMLNFKVTSLVFWNKSSRFHVEQYALYWIETQDKERRKNAETAKGNSGINAAEIYYGNVS